MRILVTELRYARLSQPFIGTLKPYAHQLKTLELVRNAIATGQTICIENTSMTGSGKTLANFAASILDDVRTCGVYPTNELLFDQYVSLRNSFSSEEMGILDSQGLDDIMAAHPHMRSHAHALAWATGDAMQKAVLTNPDVLYLAMYNLYGQMFSMFNMNFGARVFRHILGNYPVIAFDEFHLYSAKQIANTAFIMGTAKELAPKKPHIFIFSSATPQPQFKHYVQRMQIQAYNATDETPGDESRVVCEPIEVNLLPANLLRWQGGDVIRVILDHILQWADSTPFPARGVFIVDSVYEAKRIADDLRRHYPSHTVGEVHGYMDPDARAGALQRRFSVGTTTIDVGVDLTDLKSKEFLVCEARSSAQAIQRLGRLGRLGREQHEIPIANRVWIVVPEYAYHYLQQRWGNETTMTRRELNEVLNEAYLGHEDFLAYAREYAPLEAVAACERVKQQDFEEEKIQNQECLHLLVPTLYDKHPPPDQEQVERRYQTYKRKQLTVWRKFGTEIRNPSGAKKRYYLSDVESFRGGLESDFIIAIYDDLDKRLNLKPLKTYTLPFVLRRTRYEEVHKSRFEELLRRNHPAQADEWLSDLERQQNLLGYVHVHDLIQGQANEVYFEISRSAIGDQSLRVIRLEGLTIDSSSPGLNTCKESINGHLRKLKLNCWVSELNNFRLSQMLRLPPLFAVYPLRVILPNGACREWSIAFGLDAFLLDCISKKIQWATIRRIDTTAIIL